MWTVGISESEDQNDDSDEDDAAEYATEEEPDEQDQKETNKVVITVTLSVCKFSHSTLQNITCICYRARLC